MPLPHILLANDVARSNDVNDNFAYVMSIIGSLSTPGRQKSLSEFQFGIRQTGLLSAAQDTGGDVTMQFAQLSWNADWNLNATSGTWKFNRFIPNYGATVVRIGYHGFEILATRKGSGNLNTQLTPAFAARITENTGSDYGYVFLPAYMSIQLDDVDSVAGIEDYRTTWSFLDTPKMIYDNAQLNKGLDVIVASKYGVPPNAKALYLTTDVVSTSGYLKLYQERSAASRHWKYGFISRNGGSGVVQLGEGSYAGKFVIERTNAISSASVYISGYLL